MHDAYKVVITGEQEAGRVEGGPCFLVEPGPHPLPALQVFRACQARRPSTSSDGGDNRTAGRALRPVCCAGLAGGPWGAGRRVPGRALPRVCVSRSSSIKSSPCAVLWTPWLWLTGLVISCSFSLCIWAYTVLPGRFLQGRGGGSGLSPDRLLPDPHVQSDPHSSGPQLCGPGHVT